MQTPSIWLTSSNTFSQQHGIKHDIDKLLDMVNMVLRRLSSVGRFSTTFPVGHESLSALKILCNVLTARSQVLSAASFRILVHSMAPPESAAVLFCCDLREGARNWKKVVCPCVSVPTWDQDYSPEVLQHSLALIYL